MIIGNKRKMSLLAEAMISRVGLTFTMFRDISALCAAAIFAVVMLVASLSANVQTATTAAPQPQLVTSAFNQQWLNAVVSIELSDNTPKNELTAVGTGFLLRTERQHVLLVTARHVVEGLEATKRRIGYRLNTTKGASEIVWDDELVAKGLGSWFRAEADVACRFIAWSEIGTFRTLTTQHFLTENILSAAAPLLILGFPLGLRSTGLTSPIARRGIVARVDPNEIIADAFVFPGNSGGPVIYSPPLRVGDGLRSPFLNEEKLVGVVSSYISYTDVAISRQTQRPRVVFEENTGLARVVPVARLRELIASEPVQKLDAMIK